MKTNDLIAALQAVDPSGELEVCLGNADIHFVAREPAYYDGCLQVLQRDPAKADCYNIVGGEFRAGGDKLVIHGLSIFDALWDNPDLPVLFDSSYSQRHYAARIAEERLDLGSTQDDLEMR